MNTSLKPVAINASDKKWDAMNMPEQAVFLTKLAIMICSFGFIYGNVLTP